MPSNLTPVVERTFTDAMEQLQEGYVSAVAATSGVTAEFTRRDNHKYDVELLRQPVVTAEDISVRVQMKSTTTIVVPADATHFSYQFQSRAAFESLTMHRTTGPKHILVLMVVHPNQARWTYSHHRAMLLRHCCYWLNMEDWTSTAEKPTVSVPTANVFNAASLTGILDRIEGGQAI